MKSPFVGINSGEVILSRESMFSGLNQECFNPLMTEILDRFFTSGYYQHMSHKQEDFVRKYVNLAGKLTNGLINRMELPHEFIQFDRFLGGYKG